MNALLAGRVVARARLRGARVTAVAGGLLAGTVASAITLRFASPLDATDVALGALLGWGVPLLAYAAVGRACAGGRLDAAIAQVARQGVSRRGASLGVLLEVLVRVASVSAALSCLAVLFARGPSTAALMDAFTSTWVGALAGAAYVAWFGLGSLVGKKGGGRGAALLLDAVLGSGASAVALPWPRAHVRSLIGGALAHGLPEWKSAVVLYGLTALHLSLCALRFPP